MGINMGNNRGNNFLGIHMGNIFWEIVWETIFQVCFVSHAVSIEILENNDILNLKSAFWARNDIF